jgi:putative addiction module component (TIGR02574 family)
MMSLSSEAVLQNALALPVVERAKIIDQLLSSLDETDPQLDIKWAKEVEARLDAFEDGKIQSIPLAEVLARYTK